MTAAPTSHQVRDILAGRHEGQTVTLHGWVYRHRSGGGIVFAQVRDPTGVVQCTIKKGNVPDAAFEAAKAAANEASVIVQGVPHKDPRAPGGWEVRASAFELVGRSSGFPITEYQSTDDLLDKRHLWLRSRKLTNMMRVKAVMLRGFREWFDANGFLETTPSVITTNACEGGSTLFTFDYFGQRAYLSQSAQMYLEALIFSLDKAWCLTPSFRAEKSRTTKHLTEFSHLEAEAAWTDYEGNMATQERIVAHVAQKVARECEAELVELGREPSELKQITTPFPRITYDDALDRLRKKGFEMTFGDDFGQPHERALMEGEVKPMFVTLWPQGIKAFYMALTEDGKYARCADLIAPEGYGEIIGGSERSQDVGSMQRRLLLQAGGELHEKFKGIPPEASAYITRFPEARGGLTWEQRRTILRRFSESAGIPPESKQDFTWRHDAEPSSDAEQKEVEALGAKYLEPYEWYFDLRRYGSVPHAGFGLGTERVLAWLTKAEHIRDATPFPRTTNRAYP
jgi:asparaginyl-tRNA synthetase